MNYLKVIAVFVVSLVLAAIGFLLGAWGVMLVAMGFDFSMPFNNALLITAGLSILGSVVHVSNKNA
jgi:uncharacterized membrane protein